MPLREPDFVPDVDAFCKPSLPRPEPSACNPNNPTGTMMPAADFDRLMENISDEVMVIADDVYNHFVTAADYPDVIKYILEATLCGSRPFQKRMGCRFAYGIWHCCQASSMRLGTQRASTTIGSIWRLG